MRESGASLQDLGDALVPGMDLVRSSTCVFLKESRAAHLHLQFTTKLVRGVGAAARQCHCLYHCVKGFALHYSVLVCTTVSGTQRACTCSSLM